MAAFVRNRCSTFINLYAYYQNNQADNNQQNPYQRVARSFLNLNGIAPLNVDRISPHRHALLHVVDTVSYRCPRTLCQLCHPHRVAGFVLADGDGCHLDYRVMHGNRHPFSPQAVLLFCPRGSYMLTRRPSARSAACKQHSHGCQRHHEPAQTVLS